MVVVVVAVVAVVVVGLGDPKDGWTTGWLSTVGHSCAHPAEKHGGSSSASLLWGQDLVKAKNAGQHARNAGGTTSAPRKHPSPRAVSSAHDRVVAQLYRGDGPQLASK